MTICKDILCVVNTRQDCSALLERAVTLAENTQASLTVVVVIDRRSARGLAKRVGASGADDVQSAVQTNQLQELEAFVEPFRARLAIETKVRIGTQFLEVIDLVLGNGHDLVIKTPEKVTWLDRLLNSDDMNLLRMCPCPVWLAKPQPEKSYTRIVAAVDVDDDYPEHELRSRRALNLKVLETAFSLSLSEFAELHIVYAWHAYGESAMRGAYLRTPEEEIVKYSEREEQRQQANLDELMREAVRQQGEARADYLTPKTHLIKGWARKEIPVLANQLNADVIVMSTVARTGVPGFFMGNTAETILNQIDCSVLAIKPSEFETPVRTAD